MSKERDLLKRVRDTWVPSVSDLLANDWFID